MNSPSPNTNGKPLRRMAWLLIPLAFFVLSVLVAQRMGLWKGYFVSLLQTLDENELREHLGRSLLFLHGQPPLFNVLFAMVLKASAATGIPREAIAKALFLLLGMGGVTLLFHLIRRMTGSMAAAALVVALTLMNPAYHIEASRLYYTFILHFLMLAVLVLAWRYLERGSGWTLLGCVLVLAAIVNIRTLYHPLWAMGAFTIVAGWRLWSGRNARREWRPVAVCALVLLAALAAWPMKNYIVFGKFTYSTWTGFNLNHLLPGVDPFLLSDIDKTIHDFHAEEAVEAKLESLEPWFGGSRPRVLVEPKKSDGVPNWNHVAFLVLDQELVRQGMAWRVQHPRWYFERVALHYFQWFRASHLSGYFPGVINYDPGTPSFQRYERLFRRVFHPGLRRAIAWCWPGCPLLRWARVEYTGMEVELDAFAFLGFPLLVLGCLAFLIIHARKRRAIEGLVLLALFCHVFPLLAASLVDGFEGNRMRFPVSTMLWVMAAYCLWELAPLVSRRLGKKPGIS